MEERITLGQLIERMIPSDRLIVEDEAGKEIYKGYVGCVQHIELETKRYVKKFGLATNIFRKEIKRMGARIETAPGEEVSVENISEFGFADLVMQIFTRVILEQEVNGGERHGI